MSRYQFTIAISAPPGHAFDLWTNLDRMREWVGGVSRVTDLRGPLDRAGTTYTVWFGSMASRTEVLTTDWPRHFRTRFGNRMLRGVNDAVFVAQDGGTVLTQTFETQGIIPAITARIFATGSYRGSFRGELAHFGRLAEADAEASSAGEP